MSNELLLATKALRAKERRRRKLYDRISSIVMPIIGIASLLVIWDLFCVIRDLPTWLLARPGQVFATLVGSFERFWPHIVRTFSIIGIGWLTACFVGIALSAIMVNSMTLTITLTPYINFLCVMPIVALLPMMYAIWGANIRIFFIAVVLQSFPINILNSLTGFRNVPYLRTEMMISLRANRVKTFFRCTFPSSLRFVFTGMKLAAIFSTMTCIGAEMTGSTRGLGAFLRIAKTYGRNSEMLGSLILIATIGVFFYMLTDIVEAAFIKWRE